MEEPERLRLCRRLQSWEKGGDFSLRKHKYTCKDWRTRMNIIEKANELRVVQQSVGFGLAIFQYKSFKVSNG